MTLVRIHEMTEKDGSVRIRVDGNVDQNSLPALRELCEKHFREGKTVSISLQGLMHIDAMGRDFLLSICDKVQLLDMPAFLKLELSYADRSCKQLRE